VRAARLHWPAKPRGGLAILRRLLDSPWPYLILAGLLLVLGISSQFKLRPPPRPVGGLPELAALRERHDLNVIFLVVDALRADRLGAAGYPRPTTPHLDALASSGVRFAKTRAPSSWTKPAMASILTATSPTSNHILRWEDTVPEAATLPAEVFKAAGLRTLGLYRNEWLAPGFGFGQGFDNYHVPHALKDSPTMRRAEGNPGNRLLGSDADLTQPAKQFLQTFGRERFFLYLHYMDVHQYASDASVPSFGTSHADQYDSAIVWVDQNIAELVQELERLDLARRTVIVITADHGEEFGEHGGEGHGRTLYREVVDVPWILVLPFRLERGLVMQEAVSSLDVFPTLFDLMGLPPLPGAQGRSARPLLEAALGGAAASAEAPAPAFAALDRTWGQRKAAPDRIVSISTADERLIRALDVPAPIQRFDLARDPGETSNVADADPALRDRLLGLLSTELSRPPVAWGSAPPVELDRMQLEQLRALGYVVQ
jgi:arylsulfatase A-like enzyme